MCGIAGFFHFHGRVPPESADLLGRMASAMSHRGPDGQGYFLDERVGLAHRRLSIIDLETGDQPMSSPDGRLRIVFNGEIYNYLDLRRELRDYPYRTRSDTEVLLAAYDRWGADFPDRLNGIFAFALWDARLRRLMLCRDPFGVKPLHIHSNGDRLVFASEIKSLLALPDVRPEVDRQALHDFMNVRYVPGTSTLFTGIERLEPGHLLLADEKGVEKRRYFHFQPEPDESISEAQWCERIVDASRTAVKRQLMSDVPLGVYLSGGMDSSTIVAMMHDLGVPEILTFSLGFNEPTDELDDAAFVANHFGTNHFPLSIDPEPLRLMDEVLWHVEEPQVNMLQGYYIAKHASQHVKVVLGGLGGDELFAGYINNVYLKYFAWAHRVVPECIQRSMLEPLSRTVYRMEAGLDPKWDEYRRGLQMLCAAGAPARYYSILRNVWDYDSGAVNSLYGDRMLSQQLYPAGRHFEPFFRCGPRCDIVGDSLWLECNSKMVDDFLLSEDRVSMAFGLEARVPFLDLDLVKLAFSIPVKMKMRGPETKALFRKALTGWLPERITRKKKWGFSFNPYYQFQKDLKQAVQDTLTERAVRDLGFFNYRFIEKVLHHPPHPRLRWHYFLLWVMLGFHKWHDLFIDGRGFEDRAPAGGIAA